MICTSCGSQIVGNTQVCPICGAPLAQGYPQGGYPQQYPQGYPQQPTYPQPPQQPQQPQQGYPQGYAPMGQPQSYNAQNYQQQGYQQQPPQTPPSGYTGYPQGYQQPYQGSPSFGARPEPFANCLHLISPFLRGSLKSPTSALQLLIDRRDWLMGIFTTALALLLAFLGTMVITRGLLASVMSLFSGAASESAAQINQSANYIAGRVGMSFSASMMLLELIAIIVPVGVMLAYLCGTKRVAFSLPLLSGLAAVLTLPMLAALAVGMILGMITPLGMFFALGAGTVISCVWMGSLISGMTKQTEDQLIWPKALVIGGTLLLGSVLIMLIGGAVLSGVIRNVSNLLGQLGSLI